MIKGVFTGRGGEMVYTSGLGPDGGNSVEVQVLSPAPPEQNLAAFSKPEGGTREARATLSAILEIGASLVQ